MSCCGYPTINLSWFIFLCSSCQSYFFWTWVAWSPPGEKPKDKNSYAQLTDPFSFLFLFALEKKNLPHFKWGVFFYLMGIGSSYLSKHCLYLTKAFLGVVEMLESRLLALADCLVLFYKMSHVNIV